MDRITLGRTGITTCKNAFGALPIQRISKEEAKKLLLKAYDHGVTFFDTARAYSDSEEKIGYAMSHLKDIYIATKTAATTAEAFWQDLHTSLKNLKRDYVDIYQFHTPAFCPKPEDGSGLYEAMLEAKKQGKIRFISITNHRLKVAWEAVESGLYDTLQFPFSYLTGKQEEELVAACEKAGMGYLAMKALAGGLITHTAAAYAFLNQYPVLPLWGVQKEWQLDQFLAFNENPPALDEEKLAQIQKDRQELAGSFCRGCGYCMPCPAGIQINDCARMSLLIRRAPSQQFLTEDFQKKMAKIDQCIDCGHCKAHCPYGLDTPNLLKENYRDYKEILAGKPL
ncbi:MAG: aldo/keto reductase [Clostridia bacterium]|nr:aldo/keto reductase [Clostridia bacterium]